MSASAKATPARWIVGRGFDLTWIFGGALASVLVLALYAWAVPIVVLWWVWLLAFDGPHIAAAFTRTYVDREEWRTRRPLLLLSLLSFAVGPAFLAASVATGSDQPFSAFLGLAAFYGYYHVVRQHYGFLALYKARTGDRGRLDFHVDKWFLYLGAWLPYLHFLLTHPRARVLMNLAVDPSPVERAGIVAVDAAWGLALAVFLIRAVPRLGRPHVTYTLLTVLLYGGIYFVIGRREPVYVPAADERRSPDQDFLLLQILVTVFHNVQYLGLVWFHNRNRYRNRYSGPGDFGPAAALNGSALRYLAACLVFSGVVYASSACATGVFPRCQVLLDARVGPVTFNQLGLCFWWGLAVHHYVLDQKIWRVRGDAVLRRNLGLG